MRTKLFLFAAAQVVMLAQPVKFEVATIKPTPFDATRVIVMARPSTGGRFEATGFTVKFLIQRAYGVRDYQISGGPAWLNSDRFDINAKAEGIEGVLTPAQQSSAIRALIEDRFKLRIRRESKEVPAYALVAARGGAKITPAKEPGPLRFGFGQLNGVASMQALANSLSDRLARPVIDQTGLSGDFAIALKWAPEPGEPGPGGGPPPVGFPRPETDPNLSPLATAVQEQLGLRLESTRAAVDIIVVESIEKPSEN
jgi:bla regulator protein blaR1